MKARHRGDLVWRFQHASEPIADVPSALAVLAKACARGSVLAWGAAEDESIMDARLRAHDRVKRIDAALGTLATEPVGLARVLSLRYGLTEAPPKIRLVLRENAAVAEVTPAAEEEYARALGVGPREGSDDVSDWLAAICRRIGAREASGADTVAIDEVRRGAEALVRRAERAYEDACERAARSGRVDRGQAAR